MARERVTIFEKGGELGVLVLQSDARMLDGRRVTVVGKSDGRRDEVTTKAYPTPEMAAAEYGNAVITSEANGWRVAWQGQRLYG
jgi:hypothetical protein